VLGVTVRLMSDGELTRLEVLRDLDRKRLTTKAAAQLLGLERRQVFRLLKAYRSEGATGLISKRRGRRSNRRRPEALRRAVLAMIREWYWDFGPTLVAKKLREVHEITLGRETLRLWMIEAGLWLDRKQRRKRVHQPRCRRDCVGELVQVDGCEHWWFEDRGPQCTLLVFIDDATGRLMHLQFVESESTFAYFHATRAYLEAWGKPVAFYSDKHGVFRVNQTGAIGGDGMTQFGRALHALNIDIICAHSSQAKGRVERAHKTLQDRLVKTLAEGNALLPAFIVDYNARFAKPPANKKDLHRSLRAGDDLEDAFAWKEQRRLSQALTLQYDKVIFILEPSEPAKPAPGREQGAAIGKYVTVFDYPDGRLAIRHNGVDLAYRTFDKVRQVDQGAIADNKHLGAVLAMIRDEQLRRGPQRRSGPRRRDQRDARLFKVG
jgi:hypothetical protein